MTTYQELTPTQSRIRLSTWRVNLYTRPRGNIYGHPSGRIEKGRTKIKANKKGKPETRKNRIGNKETRREQLKGRPEAGTESGPRRTQPI